MDSTTFNVPSITCSICSGKIKDGIEPMKGVKNVNIDLKSQIVKVDYNPDEVSPKDIRQKIASLGYEVIM